MVIQCPSCTTKYRLNLESLPNRKTFVKCRNCGTPIYIDPPADAAAEAAALSTAAGPSPATAAAPMPGGAQSEVACPQCGTRYRVPTEALGRAGVRLKCTHCDNVFSPPAPRPSASAPAPEPEPPPAAPAPAPQREFFPGAESELDDAEPMNRPMPIPDDQELEGMFDDLRDRSTPFAAEPKPSQPKAPPSKAQPAEPPRPAAPKPPPPAAPARPALRPAAPPPAMMEEPALSAQTEESTEALMAADLDHVGEVPAPPPRPRRQAASAFNPEQAYLEAVSLDDDLPMKPSKPRGTVPDEQKYRFFLKPGTFAEETAAAPPPPAALRPPPRSPPIRPPQDAPGPFRELGDLIAPPPRVMDEPMAGAMDESMLGGIVDASMESMDLDALAGQLGQEPPLDDVDALLRDEGLDATPLPDLPRLPPQPMRDAGPTGSRMGSVRNQAIAGGLIVLAVGVLVLLFWLGFRLG